MIAPSKYARAVAEAQAELKDVITGDLLLVEAIPQQEVKTSSGIIIASSDRQVNTVKANLPHFVRVLAVGPGYYQESEGEEAKSVQHGDRDAFAGLVSSHEKKLLALCWNMLGEREEARDAAQETFVRAYTALHTFDATQPFAPWVLRIARNHCLDQLRRRTPERQHLSLDAPDADGEPRREYADPDAPRADEAMERAQTRGALEAAGEALPPNYREVVHLFHVEHLSYKEIASTMEIPIGTVMTWLHRARAALRKMRSPARRWPRDHRTASRRRARPAAAGLCQVPAQGDALFNLMSART